MNEPEYAGFWIRSAASLIDTVFLMLIIAPIVTAIYGIDYWTEGNGETGFWDILFSYVLPIIAVIVFWVYKSATPGKILTDLIIVDAKTGGKPSIGQFIIRYIGYYVSLLLLCIGYFWVGIDKRKQGFHDKMAGTLVIKNGSWPTTSMEDKNEPL